MIFTDEDGRIAVKTARSVVDAESAGRKIDPVLPDSFSQKSGVFVTISWYPSGELRGCIGFPEPVFSLSEALVKAASFACHDPRFMPLTLREAKECTVEVTILTTPVELEFSGTSEMLSQIEIGRDGVIMESTGQRALFLPQVAPEQGWNKEQMFGALSFKAGLNRNAWKGKGVRVWTFRGEVFSEIMPYGEVVRK
ncbi:MAG: TIGR00296 family protein [Candidatus Methanogranum gryphiswaldense]|nr:MAG: TIGR00296 family protein [Candidatus Methanogranum sp. U3.2.1]